VPVFSGKTFYGGMRFCPYSKGFSVNSKIRRKLANGIVAPKVAGSSPVGHPLRFWIGKPNTRNRDSSWRLCRELMAAMRQQ